MWIFTKHNTINPNGITSVLRHRNQTEMYKIPEMSTDRDWVRTEANRGRIRAGSDCKFLQNWRIRTGSD